MSPNRRLLLTFVRLFAEAGFMGTTLSYAIHGGGRGLVVVALVCLHILIEVPAPPSS